MPAPCPPFFDALYLLSPPFCAYFSAGKARIRERSAALARRRSRGAPPAGENSASGVPCAALAASAPDAVRGSPSGAAALAPSCPALLGSRGRGDTTSLLRALD